MQYEQFREWLRARGCSDNSVNVRSSEVRMVERAMKGLGSEYDDLDAAYDADQFVGLRHAFDMLRTDMRAGGDRYRIIFPNTANPQSRITASKNLLGQYGQFRSGATPDLAIDLDPAESYWFVGASFGRTDDQLERFLTEGIWEISTPKPAEIDAVRAMKVGQKIAIKAAFVQRLNLPFDNRNHNVSVMRIKARGVITENPGTGEGVVVAWDREFEAKDWFFYTFRPTIWQVQPGKEMANRLIAFAFHDEPQDIAWFRNHGTWSPLYGDNAEPSAQRFWIEKTIVAGRADRLEGEHALGRALWSPQRSKDGKNIYATMLQVQAGDVVFHLTDNEAITSASLAGGEADADFIGIEGSDWAGQPGYRIELGEHQALEPPLVREAFLETEPFLSELRELAETGVKGLFYNSRRGLNQGAYLTEATPTLLSILNRAYVAQTGRNLPFVDIERQVEADEQQSPYTLDEALEELFLDRSEAEDILLLWRAKKNVILQGPPGVGKSFAAYKLAYALMGVEDRDRVGFVQFHQSYSYEDFVEGFRPSSTGFELNAGKFVEFCRRAEADPNNGYVFVIDEINRGNLSKILGELMLLIEPDKRDQKWAMPLASGKVPFHVPANVHLLGLMNTADRSLAVVDYALRRRFAFVSLAPKVASGRFEQHLEAMGIGGDVREALRSGISQLNDEIVADTANLGPGFAIGHSFFCASPNGSESDAAWYRRVIRTEIVPLLQEYWFDMPDKAEGWGTRLLAPL